MSARDAADAPGGNVSDRAATGGVPDGAATGGVPDGAATGGVIYEVTLRVRPARAGEFLDWLRQHVAQMLALPGFLDARLSRLRDDVNDGGDAGFCCHYRLRDAAALDAYLREHAPQMREDGLRRFGGDFSAQRRILDIVLDAGPRPD